MKKVILFILENVYYGLILFFILLLLAQIHNGTLSMNFESPYTFNILLLGAICLITKWIIFNLKKGI